jgi:hypothetical protein
MADPAAADWGWWRERRLPGGPLHLDTAAAPARDRGPGGDDGDPREDDADTDDAAEPAAAADLERPGPGS